MIAVAEGVLGQVAAARRERIRDGGDWTDVTAAFVRDAAMTAAIFGFFASGWFGWAQESPPARWSRRLGVGSVLSIAVAIAGGILGWQHWSDGTVFGPETSRDFGIVVGIEFGLAGLGAIILALRKQKEF
ncbi:MAG: hypothetical protein ABWZ98_07730, partial [Nakamurella sp.]